MSKEETLELPEHVLAIFKRVAENDELDDAQAAEVAKREIRALPDFADVQDALITHEIRRGVLESIQKLNAESQD